MTDSLQFGTSGLRGLAVDLHGGAARRYTAAFLTHLAGKGALTGGAVYLARDLRSSSADILADCVAAIAAAGLKPVDCGQLPTPALALHAMAAGAPAIMVTGSHIPGDRNGLKFYRPDGEISKQDEQGILAALPDTVPNGGGAAEDGYPHAGDRYRQRYRHLLSTGTLNGWRIGVFEHSSVARDILVSMLTRAGAEVVRIGRSDEFIPVDTEAVGDAVFAPRRSWIAEHQLDAVASADGDGDRPLLIDAAGEFVRGDALGVLTAEFLGAQVVVTPVTSNSAIEGAGSFRFVQRTKVGSPFVISGMAAMATRGGLVVGFEANGGVLLGSDAPINDRVLSALPTRDAVLPILCVLGMAARQGKSLAELVRALPLRAALSDRLTAVPADRSAAFVRRLMDRGFAASYFAPVGEVESVSIIDGPRFALASGDTVHYRASGNAPELRCYVEGVTAERADELLKWGLATAEAIVRA